MNAFSTTALLALVFSLASFPSEAVILNEWVEPAGREVGPLHLLTFDASELQKLGLEPDKFEPKSNSTSLSALPVDPRIAGLRMADASPSPAEPQKKKLNVPLLLERVFQGVFLKPDAPIPGLTAAVIAVVRPDEEPKYYPWGEADTELKRDVDPEATLFALGSISKLFTAAAVMKASEMGQLNIDEDINQRLGVHAINSISGSTVTLRHLLTHTSGLESAYAAHSITRNPAPNYFDVLGRSVGEHLPAFVRPPGDLRIADPYAGAYSNWGPTLAGYVVESASKQPFAQFLQTNVFDVVGMKHSTFVEPIPVLLRDDAAEAQKVYFANIGPAGSMMSSAADAARFMQAMLLSRYFQAPRLLKDETLSDMQSRIYSPSDHVNGSGLAFTEWKLLGQRAWGHGGSTSDSTAALFLLPDHGTGIFIATNAPGISLQVEEAVANLVRYLTRSKPVPLERVPNKDLERYEGTYRMVPRVERTVEKLVNVLQQSQYLTVTAGGENLCLSKAYPVWMSAPLAFDADKKVCLEPALKSATWIPIGGNRFGEESWGDVIEFIESDKGVMSGFVGPSPGFPFQRVVWYEHPRFHYLLALALSAIFIIFALRMLISYLWSALTGFARKGFLSTASNLVAVSGLFALSGGLLLRQSLPSETAWWFGYPDTLLYALGCFAIHVITGGCAVGLISNKIRLSAGLAVSAEYALAATTLLSSFALLFNYNLIGWHLG